MYLKTPMLLSIICLTYNEAANIDKLAKSFLYDDGVDKEIFFVDGGSNDGTVEKIKEWAAADSRINLVNNEEKYVSFGFNKAFPLTKGQFVSFLGAHSQYPLNYFKMGINTLENEDCDAVGGPLKHEAITATGKAIACCMSSKFGVGNTEFRTKRTRQYVDSTAFAIYKRKVFEKAGLMDEELIRNQDDEFHYRLNKMGFKILMIPEMETIYFVRETVSGLFKQYFNYGLYKPLVLKKIKKIISIRHFIPSLFVLYLLITPLTLVSFVFMLPLLIYIFLDIYFSLQCEGSFKIKLTALIIFPVLHISYGAGFLMGLFK